MASGRMAAPHSRLRLSPQMSDPGGTRSPRASVLWPFVVFAVTFGMSAWLLSLALVPSWEPGGAYRPVAVTEDVRVVEGRVLALSAVRSGRELSVDRVLNVVLKRNSHPSPASQLPVWQLTDEYRQDPWAWAAIYAVNELYGGPTASGLVFDGWPGLRSGSSHWAAFMLSWADFASGGALVPPGLEMAATGSPGSTRTPRGLTEAKIEAAIRSDIDLVVVLDPYSAPAVLNIDGVEVHYVDDPAHLPAVACGRWEDQASVDRCEAVAEVYRERSAAVKVS